MKTLSSVAAAAVIGLSVLATAPPPAEARGGRFAGALVGGLVAGALLGSAAYGYGYRRSYYSGPSYYYSSGWYPRRYWYRRHHHHHRHW